MKLTGLARRVNAVAYDRATMEELSHLVEETRNPAQAASDALIELVLPILEDVDWQYSANGVNRVVQSDVEDLDVVGDGDDDVTEDMSSSVDDYFDPDDDVIGDEEDSDAYAQGGAVDPELLGIISGEDTTEISDDFGSEIEGLDDEFSDLERDLGEAEADSDFGEEVTDPLDEAALLTESSGLSENGREEIANHHRNIAAAHSRKHDEERQAAIDARAAGDHDRAAQHERAAESHRLLGERRRRMASVLSGELVEAATLRPGEVPVF